MILVKVAGIACFSEVFRVFVGRFACFSLDCRAILRVFRAFFACFRVFSCVFARFRVFFARFRDESVGWCRPFNF